MFETIRSNPEICWVQEDEEEEEDEEEAPEAPLAWRGQPANKDKQRCREDGTVCINMYKLLQYKSLHIDAKSSRRIFHG